MLSGVLDIFVFQAGGGIRYQPRSRGLGDEYKGQFRRCLYGSDVFQNRRNISLLFGLFFKSIPFGDKLIFISCAEN